MNPTKVEIGQYSLHKKEGALKAFFSVIIYPQGEKIRKCRYFVQGDQRWFTFPQEKIEYTDGRKPEYIPYISYVNKEYLENLKTLILDALKDAKPQEKYGEKKDTTPQNTPNQLPPDTSVDWF